MPGPDGSLLSLEGGGYPSSKLSSSISAELQVPNWYVVDAPGHYPDRLIRHASGRV